MIDELEHWPDIPAAASPLDPSNKILKYMIRSRSAFRDGFSTLFWLDTLCIPVGESLEMYRQKAIDSMAQIYAGANKVLVLDPELQNIPSGRGFPSIDMVKNHIHISPWMSRSWPLQEGAMALSLFFRLQNSSVALAKAQAEQIVLPGVRLLDMRPDIYGIIDPALSFVEPGSKKLAEIWNGLIRRETTQESDLQGILAALLDPSAEEILSLPEHERMKAILRTQTQIPLALLFEHEDSDDDHHQASWCPRFPCWRAASRPLKLANGVANRPNFGSIRW